MYRILRLGSKAFASNFKVLNQPYKLTFAITYNCNSRCKTCGIWKINSKNELKTKEIKKIFENINPSWVNLTGGEPFIRNDLYEIAKIISKKDVYLLNITTNGILVEKTIKTLKKILKLKIPKIIVVVSLDGPREIHDNLRGIKGNWDKALILFKKLKELSSNDRRFKTYLGYTISHYNIGLIKKTLEEVNKKIIVDINDFHFNIIHNSFYYAVGSATLDKDVKNKIVGDVDYILQQKTGFGVIKTLEKKYLKLIEKYFETEKSPKNCKALSSSCFISPNGDVYPCTGFNCVIGNLRDNNYELKKIWQSKKSNNVRKLIKENVCGGCWTPCEAYQTILGNILRN
jgi:MoaA/NifB/PqqE/SkfB family radical SAM enzyme